MRSGNKLIHRGRVFDLYSVAASLPNKEITRLEIIRHPGAALIVPFYDADTVIMLRQFRFAVGSYIYELPAGTRSGREKLRTCACRELEEETGFRARAMVRLGEIFPVPGYSTEKITVFKASDLKKTGENFDRDEIITCDRFDRNAIRRLFKTGRMVDAKTICAFAMIGWL